MAKHSKNNIISYDEAKQKKLHERQERNLGRHSKDDANSHEDIQGGGYVDDAQNQAKKAKYGYNNDSKNRNLRAKYGYNEHERTNRRPKYGYDENEDINNAEPQQEEHEETYKETFEDIPQNSGFVRRNSEAKYGQKRETIPRNLLNLIIVISMSLILALILVAMYNQYVVETINVVGNDEIKYHDITQLCGVDYKESMLSVKEEEIIETFESQQPMIEVTAVKKIWPNVLEIYVKERPPICFIILKGSQKCALIGEGNICLSIVDIYLEGDLPRIYGIDVGTGKLGKEITDGETRKLEVLKEMIDAMIETDCISEIESINIGNTTSITMISVHGIPIEMGDAANLNTKLANVKVMLNVLVSQNNTDVTLIVTGDGNAYTE